MRAQRTIISSTYLKPDFYYINKVIEKNFFFKLEGSFLSIMHFVHNLFHWNREMSMVKFQIWLSLEDSFHTRYIWHDLSFLLHSLFSLFSVW